MRVIMNVAVTIMTMTNDESRPDLNVPSLSSSPTLQSMHQPPIVLPKLNLLRYLLTAPFPSMSSHQGYRLAFDSGHTCWRLRWRVSTSGLKGEHCQVHMLPLPSRANIVCRSKKSVDPTL